jgi:hypothetical protein
LLKVVGFIIDKKGIILLSQAILSVKSTVGELRTPTALKGFS